MKIDKDMQEKLQLLQVAEQNLQNMLMQKQAFQFELNEAESAIQEAEKSENGIYKIVGQIMVKSTKTDIVKELGEKKQILSLRLKAIENQEKFLNEKLEKSREEIEEKLKKTTEKQ